MRSKELLKNLRKALEQDYLYNAEELEFMKEQLGGANESSEDGKADSEGDTPADNKDS